jgi:eukaryotic-like serine/threonine-protein kinase
MNIGPYMIVRKLGEGGMSTVFLTEDTRDGKAVALKLLAPRVMADEIYPKRLLREAQAVASLTHPNIGKLYEAGTVQGQPYIAMEYLEGETLSDRLATGALPIEEAIWIGAETASALSAAHAAGIVHRDIKPSNIILQPSGAVKVMDFGLAKIADTDTGEGAASDPVHHLTARGQILGTVEYMCPEQAHGEPVDFRADIFSLGVLVYEMVVGRAPFRGPHAFAILKAIIEGTPEPMSARRPACPPDLEQIVSRAMAKLPEHRFQSARAMETALRSLLPA